ncbi:septum formation initiator family protein [Salinibacterium sp. UTAS2018]|uniref:FtsB family cell division protein n=1 Tax=Salinibacterium sp. UTAS2018 TaxID=2508880 RepID=UPI00100970B0|nr:septum formation initiator family protein [Salinibacterium sp. UTAS2018]QAV71302.1 septum formation initiator family protein [Salinibacterium sp. UTAS2018]
MARRVRAKKVAVSLPEESAPEHWLRTIRFSGFTVLMLGLLILAVVVLAPNLRILIEQQQTIAQLQAQVDEAQESVDDLDVNVARWDDPAYIESQARDRLYYVYPGEVSYLVTGDADQVTTADGVPVSTSIQTTQIDWVQSLVSSIYTAGLTDKAPDDLTDPATEGPEQ